MEGMEFVETERERERKGEGWRKREGRGFVGEGLREVKEAH